MKMGPGKRWSITIDHPYRGIPVIGVAVKAIIPAERRAVSGKFFAGERIFNFACDNLRQCFRVFRFPGR